MGAGYSTEKALDDDARRYIEEQTRDDLALLQKLEYCNELLGVLSDLFEAVAWPHEFDFKGRVFNPNKRTFLVLAKYYVQVAQMFAAGLDLPPVLKVRHLFDSAFDPAAQAYYAPPEALEMHAAVVRAMALDAPLDASGCVALARNYGLAVQARVAVKFKVGFPQIGDFERYMSDIKEKRKAAAEKNRAADLEIQHRGEVFVAWLYFDLLSKKIEYLENL